MKLPFLKEKSNREYFLSLVFREQKLEAYVFEKRSDEIFVLNKQSETLENPIDEIKFEELLETSDKLISQAEEETHIPDNVSKTIFGLKESWVENAQIKKDNLAVLKKISEGLGLTPIGFMTISEAVAAFLQKEEGAPPSAVLVEIGEKNVIVSLLRAGKIIETRQSEIHQSTAFTVDTLLKHFEKMEILPSRVVLLGDDEDLVQEFIGHQWSKSLPFLHLPQITNMTNGFMGNALALGIAKQTGAQVSDVKEEILEKEEIQEEEIKEEPLPIPPQFLENAMEFFGFSKKDVAKEKIKAEEIVTEEIPEEVKEKISGKNILPGGIAFLAPKAKEILGGVFQKIKSSNLKIPAVSNLPFQRGHLLIPAVLFLIIFLLILYYFLGLGATITLSVDPKIEDKSASLIFNKDIKGDFVTPQEDGSVTVDATGKKETGNKAKGAVTIFNSSDKTITLPSGTKITSSNGLNFLTLGSVTVASRSADIPPVAGKNNVNVEAETFGTEYNLPSQTKFPSITGDSNIAARNDNAFSGGTKEEVIVVSKDDFQNARDTLLKNLQGKAASDAKAKISSGSDLVSEPLVKEVTDENFNKKEDEEAQNVTLKGTATYKFISYKKSDLFAFIKSRVGNVNTNEKNIEVTFEDLKEKDNIISSTMKLKAKIYPNFDKNDLAKKVSGKSFDQAIKILSLPQVSNVQIKLSPNLFFLPKTLPKISGKIKIEIQENG